LFSAICIGFFGRFIGGNGSAVISIFLLFFTLLLINYNLITYIYTGVIQWSPLFNWITISDLQIDIGVLLDSPSLIMNCLVCLISLLVHLYSVEYMRHDPHLPRFICYLSLFTFSMLLLVSSNNFIQLFVGWEGVGLCSYLLINFWYTRTQANLSALKAVMINRIGDAGLIIAVSLVYLQFRSLNFSTVFNLIPYLTLQKIQFEIMNFMFSFHILNGIAFFLFIAAVGKSAQIGLHTWLADAMEGPTPVSALIHSATMVSAGVFLIIRNSIFFEYSPILLYYLMFFGCGTIIFASITALFQTDMKKIIAYSTCSQLGYMFFCCGASNYNTALFHLWNHGFFKALLFLSAGSIIHALKDEQDFRKIGGVYEFLPLTATMMIIGCLALSGFPFLSGFYSKDVIILSTYGNYAISSHFFFWCNSIMAGLTALYSFKMISNTFFQINQVPKQVLKHISESSISILFPLIVLSIFSLFIGYITEDLFIGFGTFFWSNSILVNSNRLFFEFEFIDYFIQFIPTICSFFGGLFAYYLYLNNLSSFNIKINHFYKNNFKFDQMYNSFFGSNVLFLGYSLNELILTNYIDFFGPYGIIQNNYYFIFNIIKNNSGYLFVYLSTGLLFILPIGFMLFLFN
jgi:proton-translocating NADH-quinone oxidoreductase chain L